MNKKFKIIIALLTAFLMTLGIIRYNTTQFDFSYDLFNRKNIMMACILEQDISKEIVTDYKKLIDNNLLYLKNMKINYHKIEDTDYDYFIMSSKKTNIYDYCKDINHTKYLNYFNNIFNKKTDKSNNTSNNDEEIFNKEIKLYNSLTSCKQDTYTLLTGLIDTKSFGDMLPH